MTHGYEWLFEYDYVDLGDYYTDIEDWMDIDTAISEDWAELESIWPEGDNDNDSFWDDI